jgi:hypothetical protein
VKKFHIYYILEENWKYEFANASVEKFKTG